MNERTPKIICVASPRSGTLFVTKVLRNWGLDFGHEKLRPDGGIWFKFAFDRTLLPPPEEIDLFIHFVRDPRLVIPSCRRRLKLGQDFIDWEAQWVGQNLMFEELTREMAKLGVVSVRCPIELATEGLLKHMIILSHPFEPRFDVGPEFPPTDTNSDGPTNPLSWRELNPATREMAERYGYTGSNVGIDARTEVAYHGPAP